MDNSVINLMVVARDIPNRLRATKAAAAGPQADAQPSRRPTFRMRDAVGGGSGWVALRDEPGVELLAGLVGQFWHRDYGIVKVWPQEFASFDRRA
jgi:hypothetical protein